MERILNRFRWSNLSLRVKTGIIFALQLLLIVAMAAAGFVELDTVRNAVETTLTDVVQARTLARDFEIRVAQLEQLQRDLTNSFANPGFDPGQSNALSDYGNRVLQIKNNLGDLRVLRSLLSGPISDATTISAFDDFNQGLDKTQQNFGDTFGLVRQLTDSSTGALTLLRQHGQELQTDMVLAGGTPAAAAQAGAGGTTTLAAQFAVIQSLEAGLVAHHTQQDEIALQNALLNFLVLYKSAAPPELYDQAQAHATQYSKQVTSTADLLRRLDNANKQAESEFALLRDSSNRLNSLIQAQTSSPLETVTRLLGQARIILVAGLLLVILTGAVITVVFSRSLTEAMDALVVSAKQLEVGHFGARAPVRGSDEFSQLGNAFNAMSVQIEGLVGGLEQRVAERTRDLSITSEIGRAVVEVRDPRELMNQIVELIRQRFNYYHAQIFLVDDQSEKAILVASTGTAGRELLSRGHYLDVGSQSVIGQVTSKGEPVIASDTDVSGVHKRNELLPDTRSEMALPMRVGDRVIGALDVQSVAPNAFAEDVVAVFQTMADQLAVALDSARIFNQLQEAQANLEAMERRLTREAWQTYQQSRTADAPAAFAISQGSVQPHTSATPYAVQEAMTAGHAIKSGNGDDEMELAIPIKVRGEVIGAFGFGGEALQNLSEDDIALVEAVVDRVGLALENIRLVEQTTRRAEHEQIVNEITAKIVGSTDVNYILQTTVKELGRVLRAPQTSVQLRREKADNP